MLRSSPLHLVLALAAVGCTRAEEEPWTADEEAPPLVDEVSFSPPPDDAIRLQRVLSDGDEATYSIRLGYQVRMRGHLMPATVTDLTDQLVVMCRTSSTDGEHGFLAATVESADTSMDPAVEGVDDEIEARFRDAAIRSPATTRSAWSQPVSPPRPGAPAARDMSVQERELAEAMRRLVPDLAGGPVEVGDEWPFEATMRRALPGGRQVVLSLAGRYRFVGMTEREDRTLAAVDLDYEVNAAGASERDGIAGDVSGRGVGRGLFLVEPSTGTTMRSQVVETTHIVLRLAENRRRLDAEQLTRLTFDLSMIEGTP